LTEERICAKKRKGVPIVKRRERGSMRVHIRIIEEGVYQTLKVVSNGTSVLCEKEGWNKENSTGL